MPFVVTWMQLDIIILNEVKVRKRRMSYDITYTWNIKCNTSERIYKPVLTSVNSMSEPIDATLGQVWAELCHQTQWLLIPGMTVTEHKTSSQRLSCGTQPEWLFFSLIFLTSMTFLKNMLLVTVIYLAGFLPRTFCVLCLRSCPFPVLPDIGFTR